MEMRRIIFRCSFLLSVLFCCVKFAFGQCPSLSAPVYGSLSTTSVAVNTVVTVNCQSGFTVYGASGSLTCLPSNQWNFPVPLCVADCNNNPILDTNPFTGVSTGQLVNRIELNLGVYSGAGADYIYTYFGKQRIVGPTILMRAGTTCNIRVINRLSNPPVGNADYGLCPYFENAAHCLNTTNLHVHGLHVAPQEDNVVLAVSPGTYYDYIYHIPNDHHAGTFWYHTHYHGSIDSQVGLATGAIIMLQDEAVLTTPTQWANLYVDQRLVVFQELNGTTSPVQSPGSWFIVNGVLNPTININSNSWTLVRFVHAAGQHQALSLNIVDPSNTCQMQLVARDGVPQYLPFVVPQHLIVPQGGRADVALYCGSAAIGEDVYVQSVYNSSHAAFLASGNVFAQSLLFTINVQSPPYTVQSVPTQNKPLPSALQDLTGANALGSTNLTLSLTNGISGVTFTGMGSSGTYINNVPFQLNTVYNYNLTADLAFIYHPYHQHVNALQVQSFIGATAVPEISRVGEWRDVLPIHGGININVKQRPVDFWGQQVLHCHIFVHEENGMMGLLNIAEPSAIYCTSAYTQPGYNVNGCNANTRVNTTCTATCAPGSTGTVSGSVSCLQIAEYTARGAYSGAFSGCSPN